MKLIIIGLILFLSVTALHSNTPSFVTVPVKHHVSRLNFTPLVANPFEGRVGAMYQFSDNKLRLDIGNSIDLFNVIGNSTFGVDFYTFTRLRSEGNFKFPVETSDYFFGVNFSSSSLKHHMYGTEDIGDNTNDFRGSFRLRLAHISSHIVDGLADTSGKLEKKPFVYSREFADFILVMENPHFRGYFGFTGVWATQPRDVSRLIPQLGVEYKYLIGNGIEAFAAYDFKLIGIQDAYVGTNAWQTGIKFYQFQEGRRLQDSPAISLSIYGYHGRSMHGMFYKEKDSYIGTGFQFLF
jgi:hypothetical protein